MSFLDIKKIFLQEVTIYLLSKYGDKVYILIKFGGLRRHSCDYLFISSRSSVG